MPDPVLPGRASAPAAQAAETPPAAAAETPLQSESTLTLPPAAERRILTARLESRSEVLPRVFGEYELLERLGKGGMGVVYKAREAKLDRLVALKVMLPGADLDERAVRYFRNEALAAAHLDHPGIVPVFDAGDFAGCFYFTMA